MPPRSTSAGPSWSPTPRATPSLRPGDVLGSGTLPGGCLLELGPQDLGDGRGERWIEPGDVVALHADGLGTLETPIVDADY